MSPHSPLPVAVIGAGREAAPFELVVEEAGAERRYLAQAVIDASGTWTRPNPLGAGGVPAAGERNHTARISYGIPDAASMSTTARAGGPIAAAVVAAAAGYEALLWTLVALAALAAVLAYRAETLEGAAKT